MLRLAVRRLYAHHAASGKCSWASQRCINTASIQHKPLSILFCGADEFSIASLHALHEIHSNDKNKIASIDVVCRPDKRVGRGLKQIHSVPIKHAARALGLQLHQIDTFTGWTPPTRVNLVVAVSFGLLVPPRILNGAEYGGLNVHPSLLPDLRGPAPVVHTLLRNRSHTGVTVQTMHPSRFDHGMILARTPAPGLPVPPNCTPAELLAELSILGAGMLRDTILEELFVEPVHALGSAAMSSIDERDYAPKITPEDRRIDWSTWTSEEIMRRDRVLGKLWDLQTHSLCFAELWRGSPKRVTFHGPWRSVLDDGGRFDTEQAGGPGVILDSEMRTESLGIKAADRRILIPRAGTIEGAGKEKGLPVLIRALQQRAD